MKIRLLMTITVGLVLPSMLYAHDYPESPYYITHPMPPVHPTQPYNPTQPMPPVHPTQPYNPTQPMPPVHPTYPTH